MAFAFAVTACLAPGLLIPLNRLWGWVAPKIAMLNNTIILGGVFYLVISPIGIMMKLLGRDPMCRALQPASDSYWTPVQRQSTGETLHDQFWVATQGGKAMLSLLRELLKFASVHRKFWMLPAILLLLVIGGLIVVVQTSTIAPFIYALF
jgi:hypothetical protein